MKFIGVYLSEHDLKRLDKLVPRFYPNRNEAITAAIHDLLGKVSNKQ